MGCDGGTIPTRDELVRLKKKPEQKDKDSVRATLWKSCAITQEPLRQPIVACELGRLYSKESVLELLLDRTKFEGASKFDHIRGLKDVKELKLTENPTFKGEQSENGNGYIDRNVAQYICSITGLEMSGKYQFCYFLACGCVFSKRALKEVKTDTCTACGTSVQMQDAIILNGSEEEMEQLQTKMEARRLKAKLEKKQKKHKLQPTSSSASATNDQPGTAKQAKLDLPSKTSDTKPKVTGSIVANGSKLAAGKPKTIQEDPKASKAYKSLFNTCDKAKNQPKPHWITHNPCFY